MQNDVRQAAPDTTPARPPQHPRRQPGFIVRDLGDEVLIYGPDQQVIHVLNTTARAIWELCDGQHDALAMVEALRLRFAVDQTVDVEADVRAALGELHAKGLI
jgi:hypothetical protein